MRHTKPLLVFVGIAVLLLFNSPLIQADGRKNRPDSPLERTCCPWEWKAIMSKYACKPEAARIAIRLATADRILDGLASRLIRSRDLLECRKKLPMYYLRIATNPLKKAYETYGSESLIRGFQGDLFFENQIPWEQRGPNGLHWFTTVSSGKWLSRDQAFYYLCHYTGIPETLVSRSFFERHVWGPAQRHAVQLFNAYEHRVINLWRIARKDHLDQLASDGLCSVKISQPRPTSGIDCGEALQRVKNEIRVSRATSYNLLQKLKTPDGNTDDTILREVLDLVKDWNLTSGRDGRECPGVAKLIKKTTRSFKTDLRESLALNTNMESQK